MDIYSIPPYTGARYKPPPKDSSPTSTLACVQDAPVKQDTYSETPHLAQTGLTQSDSSINTIPSYSYGNQSEYGNKDLGYTIVVETPLSKLNRYTPSPGSTTVTPSISKGVTLDLNDEPQKQHYDNIVKQNNAITDLQSSYKPTNENVNCNYHEETDNENNNADSALLPPDSNSNVMVNGIHNTMQLASNPTNNCNEATKLLGQAFEGMTPTLV